MEEYTMADALEEAYMSWRKVFFKEGVAPENVRSLYTVGLEPRSIAMIAIAIYEKRYGEPVERTDEDVLEQSKCDKIKGENNAVK